MRWHQLLPAILAAAAIPVAGCADFSPTASGDRVNPSAQGHRGTDEGGSDAITVMAQNLYVGADVDAVIGAIVSPDQTDDLPALIHAIETLQQTDFPARATAIADEIARRRPHAVGLSEVSVIDIDLSGFGLPVAVQLDFLAILRAELAERGLDYAVAASVQNIAAAPLPGISLVDFDALLVDAGRVTVTAAGGQNFAVNIGPVAPGVTLIRGWVWARTTVAGTAITFASAHTEPNLGGVPLSGLRAVQVAEIVGALGSDDRVVLMGDLNDTPGSAMYDILRQAGFADAWTALRPGWDGNTCCHASDLSNRVADFSQRLDYIFARGLTREGDRLTGEIARFGDVPADRVMGPVSPIWPSDHAGLVASLR